MSASMFASSSEENVQSLPLNAYPPKQYIVGSFFDLLFVCGGFTVLLSLLYFWPPLRSMLGPSADEFSASLLFAGTYLLSQPHLGASLRRLYGEPDNIAKHRHVAFALPVVMLVSLLVSFRVLGPVATMDWLTKAYMILIVHHVLAQSYGIALMYCGRSAFVLRADEKQLFKDILYLAVTVAVVAGLHLPLVFLQIAVAALLVLVLCFFNAQLRRAALGEVTMPLPAVAVMLVSLVALILSQAVDNSYWIFIPAFFHASQYLAVVVASRWKDYRLSQAASEKKLKPVIAFAGAELHRDFLVGLTLSVAIPCAFFFIGLRDIDPFRLMFLLVSLHHFATDACLWKLRQPRVQERLV